MWFVKSNSKKFHDGCPAVLYIATILPEGIPSLKNLTPTPGAKFPLPAPSAVVLVKSGCPPTENLIIPWSVPSKTPVKVFSAEGTNLKVAELPTVWMYLFLGPVQPF